MFWLFGGNRGKHRGGQALQPDIVDIVHGHPNLERAYERIKIEEADIAAGFRNFTALAGIGVAILGFIVTGVFSALDKVTWGFSQVSPDSSQRDLVICSVTSALVVFAFLLGFYGGWQVVKGLLGPPQVYPSGDWVRRPLKIKEQSADDFLAYLIKELNEANEASSYQLTQHASKLSSGISNLFISAFVLLCVAGYNTTGINGRGIASAEKGNEPCSVGKAGVPSLSGMAPSRGPRLLEKLQPPIRAASPSPPLARKNSTRSGSASAPGAQKRTDRMTSSMSLPSKSNQ